MDRMFFNFGTHETSFPPSIPILLLVLTVHRLSHFHVLPPTSLLFPLFLSIKFSIPIIYRSLMDASQPFSVLRTQKPESTSPPKSSSNRRPYLKCPRRSPPPSTKVYPNNKRNSSSGNSSPPSSASCINSSDPMVTPTQLSHPSLHHPWA